MSETCWTSESSGMAPSSRDWISAGPRGLKAHTWLGSGLVGVSLSDLVRTIVAGVFARENGSASIDSRGAIFRATPTARRYAWACPRHEPTSTWHFASCRALHGTAGPKFIPTPAAVEQSDMPSRGHTRISAIDEVRGQPASGQRITSFSRSRPSARACGPCSASRLRCATTSLDRCAAT
jgi:hypothetical protein